MFPGVALGDALKYMQGLSARTLPEGFGIDYGGLSRQFAQESKGFVLTFVFALIIIFLALSAQFESFRDPLIILISVPMSIAGALIFISIGLGNASINIYTQVGLVTLMGLISKHGILITEFANELQQKHSPAPHSYDNSRDGFRCYPTYHSKWSRCCIALQHGTCHCGRSFDWHVIHPVCCPGCLYAAGRRSSRQGNLIFLHYPRGHENRLHWAAVFMGAHLKKQVIFPLFLNFRVTLEAKYTIYINDLLIINFLDK